MKILLPVDGTELSLHETRFALQLLREGLKASFVLANVQEPASFYEMVTADSPELIEGAALEAGANVLVAGSAVFKSEDPAAEVALLQKLGNEAAQEA